MKAVWPILSLLLIIIITSASAQFVQTVTNGQSTSAVNLSNSACSYEWINNTPGIGLPASGSGSIPSFTAINNSIVTIVATITATANTGKAYAYIVNNFSDDVSVIDISTNQVISTIPVSFGAIGGIVSPDGNIVYVSASGYNLGDGNISISAQQLIL